MSEADGRVARMKDLLNKGGGPGKGGPGFILPKPKPKPKSKSSPSLAAAAVTRDTMDGMDEASPPASPTSPGAMESPGPIVLNTDSLRQFSDTLDYDFDVVVRHQDILDSSAQKDRAALSQSKGLQNRRLPKSVANKVPEDYDKIRRSNTYSSSTKRAVKPDKAMENSDSVDGISEEISEEERKQRNLAKLGIQQNNPLGALGSLLKRNSSGRGSFGRKRKDSPGPPKTKKKSLDVPHSPISPRFGSEPPQSVASKSPKGFLRALRRNSSKSKKREGEDPASETASIVSMPIHSSVDEVPERVVTTPTMSPRRSSGYTSGGDISIPVSENGSFSPVHTSSPAPKLVPLRDKNSSSSSPRLSYRKTTDSSIFKEDSYEPLFGTTSNLFDSSELDALMGKEKEKEKERQRERERERENSKRMENSTDTPDGPPEKKDSSSVTPKSEKKRSFDSGIRANLHRYASNSSVSKDTSTSDINESRLEAVKEVEPPAKEPDTKKEVKSPAKKLKKPLPETKKKPAIPPPETEKKAKDSLPTKKASPGIKKKHDKPTVPSPETGKKSTLLFEECEDELFGGLSTVKPSVEKPSDESADLKKASLFDDDDDVLFPGDKPKEAASNSKKSLLIEDDDGDAKQLTVNEPAVSTAALNAPDVHDSKQIASESPEASKKKSHSLFDDSLEVNSNIFGGVKTTKDDTDDFLDIAETKKEVEAEEKEIDRDIFGGADTKKKDIFGDVESKEESKDVFEAETKQKDIFGSTKKDDIFGDALFDDITAESKAKPSNHSSLFDEDKTSPSLFSRERRALKTSSASDKEEGLFNSSPKTSPKTERKIVSVTEVDAFDPLGATQEAHDELETASDAKLPDSAQLDVQVSDEKERLPDLVVNCEETSSEKITDSETVDTSSKSAPADLTKGKVSPKDEKPKEKPKEDGGKPSWMAELKKRKQSGGGGGGAVSPIPKKEVTEPPMPEWKKKALERKKKSEGTKFSDPLNKPGRLSPTKAASPSTRRKTPTTTASEKTDDITKSPRPRYKTRREREQEEKEEVNGVETTTPYKTRREREREAKEKQEKEKDQKKKVDSVETRPPYKTRREREREAKEKEEKEKEEKKKVDGVETRTPYKTRREREREAKEKEEEEKRTTAKTTSPSKSGTKPQLSKKPSIEIVTKKISSTTKSIDATDEGKQSPEEHDKKTDIGEDDVFSTSEATEKRPKSNLSLRRTPSPKITLEALVDESSGVVANGHKPVSVGEDKKKKTSMTITTTSVSQNGSISSKSSVSSDLDSEKPQNRPHSQTVSLSSRSPTPPTSAALPEWKRQLMDRKKSGGTSPVHKSPKKIEPAPSKDAADIPQWKKNLLAKKKGKPDDKVGTPRSSRSATVATTTSTSSRRAKEQPTPDFMKEFQKKRVQNS